MISHPLSSPSVQTQYYITFFTLRNLCSRKKTNMIANIAVFLITFLSFLLPTNASPLLLEVRKATKTASKALKKKKFPIGAIVAIVVVVVVIIIIAVIVLILLKKRKAKKAAQEQQAVQNGQPGYEQAY